MRPILHIALAIWLVFLPGTAWGRMRYFGKITTVGLGSENPRDVTILLEGCDWDGVASSDGGHTWRVARKAPPPESLHPLPEEGPIRYRLVDERRDFHSGRLFLSEDAGATWTDVSPWRFLGDQVFRQLEERRQLFLRVY